MRLAQEIAGCRAAAHFLMGAMKEVRGATEVVKAAHTLKGTIINLNAWLDDIGWARQQFPTDYNPYSDVSPSLSVDATSTYLVSAFAEVFGRTGQGTEASQ